MKFIAVFLFALAMLSAVFAQNSSSSTSSNPNVSTSSSTSTSTGTNTRTSVVSTVTSSVAETVTDNTTITDNGARGEMAPALVNLAAVAAAVAVYAAL